MAKEFKQDDLVWAKMKGFPPWPARIDAPSDGMPPKSKKPQHCVFFFGSEDFAWILDEHIFPHSEEMLANARRYKKKSSTMQAAIQEIENAVKNIGKKSLPKHKVKIEPVSPCLKIEPVCAPLPSPSPPAQKSLTKKKLSPYIQDKKKPAEKRSAPSTSIDAKHKVKKEPVSAPLPSPSPPAQKSLTKKKKPAEKRSAPSTSIDEDDNEEKLVDSDDDYSLLIATITGNVFPNVAVIPPYSDGPRPCSTFPYVDSPTLGSISQSPIKDDEHETPTSKKIGFLGLGVMGRELVKRLLSTGHKVTIWNRSKLIIYPELVELGASPAQNPADVIRKCDIIFCCVLDAEASKCVVFGRNGVLDGFDKKCSNKAYIEMSSIDAVTSKEIAEAIAGKGGRYLEAPMMGSRQDATAGSLVILTAGDKAIFAGCRSIWAALCKHALYINCDVGSAANISILLGAFLGTCYAALGEHFALIEKCGCSLESFVGVVNSGPANFKLLEEKAQAMITNDNTISNPVKHQQKSLAMALQLGLSYRQPFSVVNAAHNWFLRSDKNHQESDVSAILKCFK